MITDRVMTSQDTLALALSLARDEHHQDTPVEFFILPNTLTKVYEDEQGPICFARLSKSVRLDIQFMDNEDSKRNASVLIQGIGPLVEQAKADGYTEIVFTTNVARLKDFCVKVFKFEVVPDTFVLRKYL